MRIQQIVFAFPLLLVGAGSTNGAIETLIENGHWKRARDAAEAAVRANPNDAHAAYCLAWVRMKYGKIDDAVKYGELAVKLDPKSAAAHRILGEVYGDQAEKASIFKQLGLARKLRSEFETAAALDPKDPDNLENMMQYYTMAPGIAGGDKKKAADMVQSIMKIDGARGYLAMAEIAQHDKENDKVEGLYQKAAEANPHNYQAQIWLAGHYFSATPPKLEQAALRARAALDSEPDRIGGYRLLVATVTAQHKFDEAEALLARAEAAIPDDLSSYVAAARVMLRDNVNLPKAEAYLKKYLEKTKEPEMGAPLLAGAHWSLALVYEKQGRKPDAIAELQTALKIKPDFEPAQKDLKRMK